MSDLPQKFAGALLFGVGEKLMRGSLLHYHAVLHENGLGGNIAGKAHLVGDHQHGHALFGQLPPAWTAVDLAEEQEEKVRLVNTVGTQNIVNVVKALDASKPEGCKMVYLSTDYVFNGQGTAPWEADCKSYAPLNIYGETKLEGELAVSGQLEKYFIVRIAWVFGQNGKNFIKTMLNIGKTHEKLTVVNDQIGTPTYTYDLARLLADMIQTEKYGYYHATNEGGYISWYDFAVEIFRQASELGHPEYDADHLTVAPVTTEEYGASKARRPFNSRLDRSKLAANGFTPLPDWKDALHRYLMELKF